MRASNHSRFWSGLWVLICEIVREFWGLLLLGVVALLLEILPSRMPTSVGEAAQDGNLAEVQRLVEGGASINQAYGGSTPLDTALMYARSSKGDNYAVAEYLIARGGRC